jgi:hypothetical protein
VVVVAFAESVVVVVAESVVVVSVVVVSVVVVSVVDLENEHVFLAVNYL